MKNRRRGILLIAAGIILLGSVGAMALVGVLGGVNGIYVGITPIVSTSFVSQAGLTFYGLVGASSTLCPSTTSSSITSCTSTTILFLSGWQDLACLHVATNACWNQTDITQYRLLFPLTATKLPAVNANIVQVNGTLVSPSTLGSTLAPGGDIYVTAWRNYVIYVAPKSTKLSLLSGVTIPVSGFNVDVILAILPASIGIVLVVLGSYMVKRKPRKR